MAWGDRRAASSAAQNAKGGVSSYLLDNRAAALGRCGRGYVLVLIDVASRSIAVRRPAFRRHLSKLVPNL